MSDVIHFTPAKTANLSLLSTHERGEFYAAVCTSLGLNHLTRPLEFIILNGKLTLYCLKEGAAQLRRIHSVSLSIISMHEDEAGLFTVHVKARTGDGREDEDIGAVTLPAGGEARCNAMMKAITKAKRRATLSVCGLGLLDETEIETIPAAANRDAEPMEINGDNVVSDEVSARRAAVQSARRLPQMVVEPPKRRLDREVAKQRHTGSQYEAVIKSEQRDRSTGKFRQFDERNPPPDDDIPEFLDRRR